jgi:2-succinyl-5-enolpyruvyl-6-hydroxy-3-cyclohexene-1-carboxylate synthase
VDQFCVAATMCATFVDEWVRLGVRHAMIAPGSRSTPMAVALVSHPSMRVEVFIDERVAAFAALGAAAALRVPVIALCTSGTAATEFHSAVVEAHHAEVPLVVLTADRPPELQGVGAPQTIDQRNLFGVAVRRFVDVAPPEDTGASTWRGLARDIVVAATGARPGPVHANLAFREPLLGLAGPLPERHSVDDTDGTDGSVHGEPSAHSTHSTHSTWLDDCVAAMSGRRGVFVAGTDVPDSLLALAATIGWPVWADPRSGVRRVHDSVVCAMDPLLRDDAIAERLRPDVVVRFGALPASKVVAGRLREWAGQHLCITPGPTLIDPDRIVTRHVVVAPDAFVRAMLTRLAPAPDGWMGAWSAASKAADAAIAERCGTGPLSEPAVAHVVARDMPLPGVLVASSSMPIRDVEWFAPPRNDMRVHSNRGANGIDGVVSTAIGVAIATGGPVVLLIGDVAFLHDSGALVGITGRGVDVRVVLVDNHGGGIFSFLPQASALASDVFERLFGTPHSVDIAALTRAHSVRYEAVQSTSDLTAALQVQGPVVIHVTTDRSTIVADHEAVHGSVRVAARRALAIE